MNEGLKDILKGYKPVQQGKVVAEADGDGWLIMFPDGTVDSAGSRKAVERKAKKWFETNLPDKSIGIGSIEWRS